MCKPRSLDPKAQTLNFVIRIMSTCVPYALAQPMSYMGTHPLRSVAIPSHEPTEYK